ncbi:MAG: transcription antitermination factor NusB [Candidatus Omnitrophica bacterium]|nr:transcription antitermination factor NusB [Candidatus Omnitrophota bacterium]
MRVRSKAREIALCVLYQVETSKLDGKTLLDRYIARYPQKQEVIDFAHSIVEGVASRFNELDVIIKRYAKNWQIDRMAIIDRNILRLTILELMFLDGIPPKVSINEAIELAKRFGDIDSPRFVNGILDKVYKSEKKENESQGHIDTRSHEKGKEDTNV